MSGSEEPASERTEHTYAYGGIHTFAYTTTAEVIPRTVLLTSLLIRGGATALHIYLVYITYLGDSYDTNCLGKPMGVLHHSYCCCTTERGKNGDTAAAVVPPMSRRRSDVTADAFESNILRI